MVVRDKVLGRMGEVNYGASRMFDNALTLNLVVMDSV